MNGLLEFGALEEGRVQVIAHPELGAVALRFYGPGGPDDWAEVLFAPGLAVALGRRLIRAGDEVGGQGEAS